MKTAADIVDRAFRKIGVKAEDEALTADQMANGLDALNDMIAAWKLEGVDFEAAELAATDEFPLAREFHEGTIYILATRLNPDYMVPPQFDADKWFRAMQAAKLVIEPAEIPAMLLNTSSQRRLRV